MSTLFNKWCSLKRGDIIKLEKDHEERIVSHVIQVNDDFLILTFQNNYLVLCEKNNQELIDFEIVGYYLLPKDKELSSTKAH